MKTFSHWYILGFVLGMLFFPFLVNLLVYTKGISFDRTISYDALSECVSLCDKNEGLKRLEVRGILETQLSCQCRNGAEFDINPNLIKPKPQ